MLNNVTNTLLVCFIDTTVGWGILRRMIFPVVLKEKSIFGNTGKNITIMKLKINTNIHTITMYMQATFHVIWSISIRDVHRKL